MGRSPATISRELRRGAWQPERDHANLRPYLRNKLATKGPRDRLYLAVRADHKAKKRAKGSHQAWRMNYDPLITWVLTALQKGWTPEEICGRLPIDFPDDKRMRVSVETLYQWIYSGPQKRRELWQYLCRGHKKRRRRRGRNVHRQRINYRVSIHDRPKEIDNREEFGHWESDSVLGKHGTGILHTTVERTSRYLKAIRLDAPTAQATVDTQIRLYKALPAHSARSVTADNGTEFSYHYKLADTLAIPTYFADPYSAWQRGTNEHFNGRIRKYLPKGTSFADLTQQELDEYVTEINNRPRKILGWATPTEIFEELSLTPTTHRCTSN